MTSGRDGLPVGPTSIITITTLLVMAACCCHGQRDDSFSHPSSSSSLNRGRMGASAISVSVVPQPQDMQVIGTGSTVCHVLSGTFSVTSTGFMSSVLQNAMTRYGVLVRSLSKPLGPAPACTTVEALEALVVDVTTADETLGVETNESYTLTVEAGTYELTAVSCYGALRGLETFSQLISLDLAGNYFVPATSVRIRDSPRFQHRGLMIDTGEKSIQV